MAETNGTVKQSWLVGALLLLLMASWGTVYGLIHSRINVLETAGQATKDEQMRRTERIAVLESEMKSCRSEIDKLSAEVRILRAEWRSSVGKQSQVHFGME